MIEVEYQGEMISLTVLARRCDLNHKTVHNRYRRGRRGKELWAPTMASMARPHPGAHPNPDSIKMREEDLRIQARAKSKDELKKAQQRRRADELEAIRREHRKLFEKPLISKTLLSHEDRIKIANDVRRMSQLSWKLGGSFGPMRSGTI